MHTLCVYNRLLEVSLHHLFHVVEQHASFIRVSPADVRFAKGGRG